MDAPAGHEADRRRQLLVLGRLRESYCEAVLTGEEPAAERVIREAIESGIREVEIDEAIITPAMRRVGDLWATGEISIADEHLATDISLRMIALQRESFRVASERASRRVLLCGLEGERHTVGLEMAASVLLHAGFDVRMLGADVPVESLGSAMQRHRPGIVGFSATIAATARLLPAAVYEVRASDAEAGVMVGGPAASLRMQATPGVSVCTHVADAVEIADALIQRADLN